MISIDDDGVGYVRDAMPVDKLGTHTMPHAPTFCGSELLEPLAYEVIGDPNVSILGLSYDSRKVTVGDLFFCIPGVKSDGHSFAEEALRQGASALVVEHEIVSLDTLSDDPKVTQFVVADVRQALAHCAARFYGTPSSQLRISGITGTNGKTTTSYLLDWILRYDERETGVIGTVEIRVGDEVRPATHTTPESLDLQHLFADMRAAGVSDVAMEISSHAIALDRIYDTRFSAAAFSNLTQDHLDFHKDLEDYFLAKARLFTEHEVARRIICIDDIWGKRLARMCLETGHVPILTSVVREQDHSAHLEGDLLDLGLKPDTAQTLIAHTIRLERTKTTFTLESGIDGAKGSYDVELPLTGMFNVENALLALGCAYAHGVTLATAVKAIGHAPQTPGRLERVRTTEGFDRDRSILVDYAHTPDSLNKAISAVRKSCEGRTIVVFGCGGDRDRAKRPLMGAAAQEADIAIVTSDNPRSEDPDSIIEEILVGMEVDDERVHVVADRRAAIAKAVSIARAGDSILIAGKGHEDYQLVGDKVLSFDDRVVALEEVTRQCL